MTIAMQSEEGLGGKDLDKCPCASTFFKVMSDNQDLCTVGEHEARKR